MVKKKKHKQSLTCIAFITVLLSEDPQYNLVPNPDKTLLQPLVGTGEAVGENPQTETELVKGVEREIADGKNSI